MNILFIFDGDLNKIDNGAAKSIKKLIKYAPKNFNILITSYEQYEQFEDRVIIKIVHKSKMASLLVRLFNSNSFRGISTNYDIVSIIKDFEDKNSKDYAIVFTADTNDVYRKYVTKPDHLYYFLGDIASLAFKIHVKTTRNIFKKCFYLKEELLSRVYEHIFANSYKKVFLVNEIETKYANSKYKTNKFKTVFPGFEKVDKYDVVSHDGINLVFIGNLKFKPNYDGIKYFYEHIFKKLGTKFHLHLIGAGSENAFHDDRVIGYGFIDDFNDVLKISDFGICYMINGGGLKNKIFDYMKYGLPCIINSYVKNNTAKIESEYILEADTLSDFIRVTSHIYKRNDVIDSISQYEIIHHAQVFWHEITSNVIT